VQPAAAFDLLARRLRSVMLIANLASPSRDLEILQI
jgi:hypothetical protein